MSVKCMHQNVVSSVAARWQLGGITCDEFGGRESAGQSASMSKSNILWAGSPRGALRFRTASPSWNCSLQRKGYLCASHSLPILSQDKLRGCWQGRDGGGGESAAGSAESAETALGDVTEIVTDLAREMATSSEGSLIRAPLLPDCGVSRNGTKPKLGQAP